MTFYGRNLTGTPPTAVDVFYLTSLYLHWERGIAGYLDGYSSVRSGDSHLVQTTAQSIDPRGEAFLNYDLANVEGEVPSGVRVVLPTTLAPLIPYDLGPDALRMEGRTYAVGYAADQTGSSDRMALNALDRAALQTVFQSLVDYWAGGGWRMVCLRTRRGGVPLSPCETYDINRVKIPPELLSSQRRRTFRGR